MTQSLKSAMWARVSTAQSTRLYAQRFDQGEGLMCPASAGDINHDIYMRPAPQSTLLVNDASCSHYTKYSAGRRIEVENLERPYTKICAAGLRGNGDFLGLGRDLMPQNLYGQGREGNFVRHYPSMANAPPPTGRGPQCNAYGYNPVGPFLFSHDATGNTWRG